VTALIKALPGAGPGGRRRGEAGANQRALGAIVEGPGGAQTIAFEPTEDGLIGAIYIVRNPDKLRGCERFSVGLWTTAAIGHRGEAGESSPGVNRAMMARALRRTLPR